MLVLDGAILDTAKCIVEFRRDGSGLLTEVVALALVDIVETRDRRDNSCGTAGASLLEGSELLYGDGATLHLQAQILGNLHQTLVGDAGEDGRRLRRDVGVLLDTKEVGSATLIDVLLLLGVEVEL